MTDLLPGRLRLAAAAAARTSDTSRPGSHFCLGWLGHAATCTSLGSTSSAAAAVPASGGKRLRRSQQHVREKGAGEIEETHDMSGVRCTDLKGSENGTIAGATT